MKKILFVCVENSCRSQMAEGIANYLGKNKIKAYSAGSRPSGRLEPYAIKAMQEIKIDISSQKSKGFDELPIKRFDYVITLGCQDTCPFVPAHKHLQWEIEDPKGKDIEFFRKTRDEIKERIKELLKEITAN